MQEGVVMPRMITCFECMKEYMGRSIIFNFSRMDPYFYDLYHREPHRFLQILTLCKECEGDDMDLEKKEW